MQTVQQHIIVVQQFLRTCAHTHTHSHSIQQIHVHKFTLNKKITYFIYKNNTSTATIRSHTICLQIHNIYSFKSNIYFIKKCNTQTIKCGIHVHKYTYIKILSTTFLTLFLKYSILRHHQNYKISVT